MVVSKETKEYFSKLIEPLATNEYMNDLFEKFKNDVLVKLETRINEQDKQIERLESQLALRQNTIDRLIVNCDDNEQYSRRSCLRIKGVEIKNGGKNDNVMELLEKCYSDIGLQFKPQEIDRAHRIGKTYSVNDTRITTKDIIVKYKSWDPRSAFYKARPKFFKNGARMETRPTFSVALDLTKRRYDLLNHAREKSKSYPDVQFAFVDINCSLVVKMKNDYFEYFNDKSQLDKILSRF